jgi:hypothetical protein
MSSFPPNAGLLHLPCRWPAGNLRQIKELAISSIADTTSLLAAEGDAGLTVDESRPVFSGLIQYLDFRAMAGEKEALSGRWPATEHLGILQPRPAMKAKRDYRPASRV